MNRALFFRNILSQYARYFLPVGIAIFLTPFLLRRLGDAAYGIYVLSASLAAFFTVIDLGLETAVARYTAEYTAKDQGQSLARLAAAGFVAAIAAGLIGLAVCVGFAHYAVLRYGIPTDLQGAAQLLILLNGVAFLFSKPANLLASTLHGLKRFDVANAINVSWSLAHAIIVTLAIGFLVQPTGEGASRGLIALGVIAGAEGALGVLCYRWALRKIAPQLRFSFRGIDWRHFPSEIRFAAWTMVDSFAGRVALESDPIVIGRLANAAAVTPYAIGAKWPLFLFNGIYQGMWVMLPYFTGLRDDQRQEVQRRVFLQGTQLLLAVLLPSLLFLAIFADRVLEAWTGHGAPERVTVMRIFCAVTLVWCCDGLPVVSLYGEGKVKQVALLFLGESSVKLVLGIALFYQWGIVGLAVGTVVPAWTNFLFILLPWTCRRLGLTVGEFAVKTLTPQLVPLAAFGVVLTAGALWLGETATNSRLALALQLLARAVPAGVAYLVAYWFLSVSRDNRARAWGWLRQQRSSSE
jgi:O-antigen/teichoic acid export membrane protein